MRITPYYHVSTLVLTIVGDVLTYSQIAITSETTSIYEKR